MAIGPVQLLVLRRYCGMAHGVGEARAFSNGLGASQVANEAA
jgi:hypothetical protein